jgi:hypothetical protein
MRKAFDRPNRQENLTRWKWTAGFTAACGVVIVALVALTWNSPAVMSWISEAAQAEFVGTMATEQAPVQTAQPAREFHTIKEFHAVRAN